ncbi:acyl-CoA dehydrogenase/oxidase [Kockovaella imperatae]|uniref:Acyl-CoA dehydrogenase/oxidase n=1 Tax=Kockovaella imperatae TaxID=4999 RepID=A0A1Y1URK3_9TREE|nr:acyl-CoA dehydrogenase/oxidase [Kockovaella imperatae]ORX39785.1 acyl-CoA dehydrogenase/oxidase [Kockovaella imperatae]
MATQENLKTYTKEEVAKHNTKGDLWIIVNSYVYDLSKFANLHPGGAGVLLDQEVAGQDATTVFFGLHRSEVLMKPQYDRLKIGQVQGEKPQIKMPLPGDLSTVPYGEPTWLTPEFKSPYYKQSHRDLQKAVRKFVDEVLYPDAQLCEENGKRASKEVLKAMAENGFNRMRLGPGKHLHGQNLMGGVVKGEEFDYFHEMVLTQELVRIAARGYADGLNAGMVIGLPPVLNFGQEPLRSKVLDEVFRGEKVISLAISEAFAGSDVSGLKTEAVRSEDGKSWTINGTKKWISGGMHSDYFTVGARTDGGLTVFLVPRSEGVETKQIKTSYSTAAGTAYITFDNCVVPDENRLGEVDAGLLVILSNFNHERFIMVCASVRSSRAIVEESMKWASQRIVFGKPLMSQAVIRSKFASMIAKVEAMQAWLENVTYQMCHMTYKEQSRNLAGQIAFLKVYATRAASEISDDAVQIWGGRALTKTGMGKRIKLFQRSNKFDAVLGGAEDVLADLGVRQAMRKMPADVRL